MSLSPSTTRPRKTRVRIRPGGARCLFAAAAAAATCCFFSSLDSVQAQSSALPNLRAGEDTSKEKVFADDGIKQGLAKHQLSLIPNAPHPPEYAQKGTQYGDLTPEKDFSYKGGGGAADWCTTPNQAVRWTSEKGSVMLNGHPIWLKGINWQV